jgi:folylpolyglutamate synthase
MRCAFNNIYEYLASPLTSFQPSDFDILNPIHVAGTKGKGSTSAFISSILTQYLPSKSSIHAERLPSPVGLYTSPHLRSVRERIKIDDLPISEKLFAECFWEIWDRFEATKVPQSDSPTHAMRDKPVYFHFLTIMALHCYMQAKVGTAVIECGIGGEYDTTNILVQPSVTAVTSLGIDHVTLLGSTIEEIAWHKAGIFKEGVPAFSTQQPDTAVAVLHQRAAERNTKLYIVPPHAALVDIALGLQGHFQTHNASLAIAVAAAHLQKLGFNDVPDPFDSAAKLPDKFITGLESTRLGGRCDLRPDSKIADLRWYIDGAHTMESIDVVGQWFASQTSRPERFGSKRVMIFNQQTRDASALATALFRTLASATDDQHPFSHAIFCPNTTYKDAGYKADLVSMNTSTEDIDTLRVQKDLATTWRAVDTRAEVHVLGTIEEAIALARSIAGDEPTEVLVTGSLHLVGGCIEILEAEVEESAA